MTIDSIVLEVSEIESCTNETFIRDLYIDSLEWINIIVKIELEFNIIFQLEEMNIERYERVIDLKEKIVHRIENNN